MISSKAAWTGALVWGLALLLCLALPGVVRAVDPPDTVGLFRPDQPSGNNTYFLLNQNILIPPSNTIAGFGDNGDRAVVGDWNGDGIVTIGVFRANTPPGTNSFYLRNTNTLGVGDITIEQIGQNGDIPIVGDWDGNGSTTVGLFRANDPPGSNTVFLWNSNINPPGPPDVIIAGIGAVGDLPFVGHWNGLQSTIGLIRSGSPSGLNTIFLWNTNANPPGPPDTTIEGIGAPGDTAVSGAWTGAPTTAIGLFRSGEPTGSNTFFLWNTNPLTPPYIPDTTIVGFGVAAVDRPVTGRFGNNPPTIDPATFNATQNSPNGTVVGTVTASDPDPGDTLTYSIEAGNTDTAFAIDNTGQITVANGAAIDGTPSAYSLTVRVTDDGTPQFFKDATITVNVTANAAPQITEGDSTGVVMDEDGTPTAFSLTLNATDADGHTITWSISTPASNGNAGASGTGTSKIITYAPNANYAGSDSFVVQVSDGFGGTDTITVNVTINPINDAPSFTLAGNPPAVNEDAGAQSVLNFATNISRGGGADEAGQTLTFIVQNNTNTGLFAGGGAPAIDSATGTLTYTPAANVSGTADITIVLQDSGSGVAPNVNTSASQQFTITVNSVNDPPSFTLNPGPPASNEDAGPQTVAGFAQNIVPGPPDEAGQVLTFMVTNNTNPGLFTLAGAPAINPANGNLTYTAAPNANGSADITVVLQDNGSNTPPSSNTSPPQQFTITVNSINDAPVGTSSKNHAVTGNVRINVNVASSDPANLLNGVTDLEGNALAAELVTQGTNGTAAINANGTYTYNPNPGYTGTDTVTFRVCDNGVPPACTAAFNINITVSDMLWFIDNSKPAGDGRLTSPFNSIGAFTTANDGAANHPKDNQVVFIDKLAGDYTGTLTLRSGQKVLGKGSTQELASFAGITLAPHSDPLPTANGTAPNLTTTTGTQNVVNVASGNTLRGFAIGTRTGVGLRGNGFGTLTITEMVIGSPGQALSLTTGTLSGGFGSITSTSAPNSGGAGDDNTGNNVLLTAVATSGTFALGSGALSGAAGSAFKIDGQNGTFTYSGTITNASTLAVDIANKNGGAVTLSGDINPGGAARGISAVGNTGSTTLTFSGAQKKISVGGSGTGVGLTNNTGSTVTFSGSGGLAIDTTASTATAFFMSDTGNTTVNVSGTGNTITGSGQALSTSTAGANAVSANMTFDSVSSSGGSRNILLTRVNGSVTMNGGTLSGSTVTGVDIDRGTGSVTYAGNFNTPGRGISVTNKTGGTVAFSGGTKTLSTTTAAAVTLTSNAGTTINFSNGGLAITTTSGAGFTATGGATAVNVTGTGNTISSGSGTALNVVSTTIGGSGLNFLSIAANGGTDGIVLTSTGTNGLTVTGTGTTDGSGGTIQSTSNYGANFTSANNISLGNMTFTNAGNTDGGGAGVCDGSTNAGCHAAINLSTVSNVSLTNIDISGGADEGINGSNVTHLTLADSTIQNVGNAVNEHGIYIRNLFGTVANGTVNSISNTTVTNAGNHNVFIVTSSATNAFPGQPDRLELTNSTFSNPGSAVPSDGVTVAVRTTANYQTVVSGSTFSRVTSACCDGIQVDAGDTSHSDVSISTSTFTGPWGQSAINLSGANTSATTFNVSNNPTITGGVGQGINIASNNASTLSGTIANNPSITTAQALNAGQGIWALVDSGGHITVDINTNTISGFANGIVAGARNTPQGQMDVTIRNNTVSNGGNFPSYGVWVFSGNGSGGETNRTCLNLNSANNNVSIAAAGIVEYALEQYSGTTLQLQGFVGTGTSATDVTNYVDARDTGATSVDPNGLSGFLSVTAATCAVP